MLTLFRIVFLIGFIAVLSTVILLLCGFHALAGYLFFAGLFLLVIASYLNNRYNFDI